MYNINDTFRIFASQSTETTGTFGEGPSLYRDFVNEKQLNGPPSSNRIGPDLTFARNSEATFYNADGYIVTSDFDVPRFNYDPYGIYNGLLVEEQRINVISYSADFAQAPTWVRSASSTSEFISPTPGLNIVPFSEVSPSYFNDATLLQANDTVGYKHIYFTGAPIDLLAYSRSIYIKKQLSRYIVFGIASTPFSNAVTAIIDLNTGSVVGGDLPGVTITPVNNGWFRVACEGRISSNSNTNKLLLGLAHGPHWTNTIFTEEIAATPGGVYIWGAQVERGLHPSSYIPTEGSIVIRDSDVVRTTVGGFINFYNKNEGSFYVVANRNYVDEFNSYGSFSNNDNSKLWNIGSPLQNSGFDPNTHTLNVVGGSEPIDTILSIDVQPNTDYTVAAGVSSENFKLYENQSFVGQSLVGTLPTNLSIFQLGAKGGTNYLNGHIKKFGYWPKLLSDIELGQLN